MSKPIYEDPVVARIHAIRAQMLAECGGDHQKLMEQVEEHQRAQEASGRKVIPAPLDDAARHKRNSNMNVPCCECVVENGRIKLPPGVVLPEGAKVYVIVPAAEPSRKAHVMSPRLAHPEQAQDFVKEVRPHARSPANRPIKGTVDVSAKSLVTPLGIVDLLKVRGFDQDQPTKLVRHKDRRWDVEDLRRRGWLEFYQATQSEPVFDGCERIVSFIGTSGTKARLIGVYSVLGRRDSRAAKPPKGFPAEFCHYRYYYDLRKDPGYENFENRVVVEWGKGTLSWVQWLSNKEVVELLPAAQTRPPFRDYLEFTLTHSELRELYNEEDANREWRARLSAVAGVYLIVATRTGRQYVGSAYGAKGIWGRWAAYAANGHGDNKLLKALLAKDSAYPEAFTYSILQILPKTFAAKEVIRCEQCYKEKLGSCAIGLNVM